MASLTPSDSSDPESQKVAPSFSGNERNRMFLQRDGNFKDVSLVSGTDFRQDGRGFALLDYDRDGFVDIVTTSPTSPRLRILRNRLGDRVSSKGNFVNILLRGGNSNSSASDNLSSANGCGALIEITAGDKTRMFEESCGEGLSAQNSKWIHIGLGKTKKVDSIKVMWPSGNVSTKTDIEAGSWIEIEESATE